MRKVFCDSCEVEIKNFRGSTVDIPCHIFDGPMHGYVDNDGNGVSGRTDSKDLCNKCWNIGWKAFVKATGIK